MCGFLMGFLDYTVYSMKTTLIRTIEIFESGSISAIVVESSTAPEKSILPCEQRQPLKFASVKSSFKKSASVRLNTESGSQNMLEPKYDMAQQSAKAFLLIS
uniref:Uncharacterized protein n=1 Tax=Romanomermis culicivorax TaxID=13658 RepID=A0A915IKD2_ROMCU